LGIPDAPDPLPAGGRLVGAPWTLCSGLSADGQGGARAESVLFVGADPGGGSPLTDEAVLLRHPDGSLHLVWQGRRHLVRDPSVVLPALGWSGQQPAPAAPAFLNALPAGVDLARIALDGRGTRSAAVPDARVGEVYVVEGQGGGRQHVVVVRDGLAVVTQLEADLLIGDPLTASMVGQVDVEPMSLGRYALLPKVGELRPANELSLPAATPTLTPAGDGVCAVFRDADGVAEVRTSVPVPAADVPRTGSGTGGGAVLADRVAVPPGGGAVVEAMASPRAGAGTFSVVTDLGLRYEVPGPDVLAMLGFGEVAPLRLPTGLVALLPAGRALDPAAARSPLFG
ncbi:MAG: type VII secretion protein EccB, partial [Micromonosporaceae bacterium]